MTGVPLMENDDKLKSIINAPEGTHVVRTGLDPAKVGLLPRRARLSLTPRLSHRRSPA